MTAATITSVTDMKAAFPAPPTNLTIVGTPNLHNLVEILIYLARCAQTHKSTISPNMNLLYVAVPPAVYAHYTQEMYPADMYPYPPLPPDAPNFQGAADPNDREQIKYLHSLEVKRYQDVQNMNTALIDKFLELLPTAAKIAYEAIRITNPNAVFRECFDWFVNKYGKSEASDRKNNIDNMTLPWTPNDGFDALLHRLFLADTYAICAQHPLQQHQILDAAVIVLQNCGLYPEEMKAWKKRTAQEGNDYAAFKIFWEQAIRIADTSMATPAMRYDYGINAVTDDDKSAASRTSALESSISTFGSAYAATEERVRNQNDTINNMQGQINNLQQQLLCQPVTMRQPNYPPRNNYYNNQRGGRGGYRTQQHVPTGPPATQVTPPNPYKKYENMNYCYTHGGDIDDYHTSATCTRPGQYHKWHATRDNPMDGSMAGMHKTILPSVSGRRPSGGPRNNGGGYNNNQQTYQRPPAYPTMMQQYPTRPSQPVYNTPAPAAQMQQAPPPTMPTMYQQHRAMTMMAPPVAPPVMPTYQPMAPQPMMMQPMMQHQPQQQGYYNYNY